MAGKKSLRKGKTGEYKARKYLESLGYEVTWQAEDPKRPDLRIIKLPIPNLLNEDWEVKYQGSGISKKFYQWLDEKSADALMVKRVKQGEGPYPWLIIRRLK